MLSRTCSKFIENNLILKTNSWKRKNSFLKKDKVSIMKTGRVLLELRALLSVNLRASVIAQGFFARLAI